MYNVRRFTVQLCLGFITLVLATTGISQRVQAQVVNGSFSFQVLYSPFIQGCVSTVDIMVNTGSNTSNAANIIINYEPSEITIIDANSMKSGTQIEIGTAYESYADNVVDTSSGTIRLTGFATNTGFSGQGVFGTIQFRSKAGVTNTKLTIDFTLGDTLDSNIAEVNSSDDILGTVKNKNFNFTSGSCFTDTQGPTITPLDPQNYDVDVDSDTDIIVEICDPESGVSLASVIVSVLGEIYTFLDVDHFSYEGNSSCYTITVNPEAQFPVGEPIVILYKASDFNGNTTSVTIIFNIPPEEDECIDLIRERIVTIEQECEKCQDCEACEEMPPEKDVVYIEVPSELPITGGRDIALRIDLMKDVLSVSGFFDILSLILATLAMLLAYPSLIIKKVKKPWGLVYDKKNRKPVAFAIIRLYSEGKLIAEEVTDLEGRYGFPVEDGMYILEASAQGYKPYKVECDVTQDQHDVNRDIILQPKRMKFRKIKSWLLKKRSEAREFFPKISTTAFVVGFMIILITCLINLSFLNLILLGLYIIIITFHIFTKSRRSNGTVYDSKTNEEIAYVAVRLFDAENNKLIDNVMSTKDGKYMFIVTPKKYYLLASRKGYSFPSKHETQSIKDVFYGSLLEVDVKKGNILAIDIAMDQNSPSSTEARDVQTDSYESPFSTNA